MRAGVPGTIQVKFCRCLKRSEGVIRIAQESEGVSLEEIQNFFSTTLKRRCITPRKL